MKEVAQYKIDLAKDLSEILTKALLKPAAMEQLVAGTHIFSFGEGVKPRPISPFNPEYMDEVMTDLNEFVSRYANSKEYSNLMDGIRKEPEFIETIFIPDDNKGTTEIFMGVINKFSQLMENVEQFLDLQLDPLQIDPRYDAAKFDDLFRLFGKVIAIIHIEITPCVYPLLYKEFDLRNNDYYGYTYSRSDGLTAQLSGLIDEMCTISNNLIELRFRDKIEDDEVEADE